MAYRGLVDSVMASDSVLKVWLTALECWNGISMSTEKRIDSGEAKKKMEQMKDITTTTNSSGGQHVGWTQMGSVSANHSISSSANMTREDVFRHDKDSCCSSNIRNT
jgi:hypothetical protein